MTSLDFVIATSVDLKYLTKKTRNLHEFETIKDKTYLEVTEQFEDEISQWLKSELEQPNSVIFLIKIKQKTIGFAHIKILANPNRFTIYHKYGYIQSLWIDEEYRKNKYASLVINFIEDIFREEQVEYYELSHASNNSVANRFWEKMNVDRFSIHRRKFLNHSK